MEKLGLSGRIANAFISSKLTPLIVIASLLLGVFAVVVIPREEDPQIIVPMIDVMVTYPGASAQEVEDRVTRPMERFLWEIKGVEYLYSIVRPGMNLTIVRFYVGQSLEDSLVNLYNKLMSNYDKIPPGVSQPLVKPKSIDDVPILALTLWDDGGQYSGYDLRRMATELCWELKKDHDIAETTVIGGQKRQLRVILDPVKLQSYRVSPGMILGTLEKANFMLPSGSFPAANREFIVETGGLLKDIQDVGQVLVATTGGKLVYLKDVADISDGPEEVSNYVFMGTGPAAQDNRHGVYEAVTIAIAKKKGTNATHLAERALGKIEQLRGIILPASLPITVTRNYGDTAKEKSDELLYHMFLAAVSVTLLIALALGWRESLVVGVAVPVTLALTIFFNYLYGYTLNRVTLFALIFSIGILVDDAIVVVENIHRHFRMGRVDIPTAIGAVDEVGNPTILATFTVIAALLPMAFVSGLMGPYMRPIPVGASAAMVLSLLIAFIISPWLSYIVLKGVKRQPADDKQEEGKLLGKFNHLYENNLRGLLNSSKRRMVALLLIVALMGAAVALIPFKGVALKMLPFDNKSELQVVLDMPEGSALESTAALAREVGEYLRTVPEVTHFQLYVGTASPFNFNGLVRHYYLRSGNNQADIQVNFVGKGERKAQSHDLAKRLRPEIKKIGDQFGARIKVVEIPPGPPVLSTLVAEVYGPDQERRIEIARQIKEVFAGTDGVVDIDWYVEADQPKVTFAVDREKAAQNGLSSDHLAREMRIALNGMNAGLLHLEREKEPTELLLRLPLQDRADIASLKEVADTHAGRAVGIAIRTGPDQARRGRQNHLSQQPEECDLRHCRCRRAGRKPGLCHPQNEGCHRCAQTAGRLQPAAALFHAAASGTPLLHEMGW